MAGPHSVWQPVAFRQQTDTGRETARNDIARKARRLIEYLRAATGSAFERCDVLLQRERIPGPVLSRMVAELHEAEEYDLAVECLLAAVRHNQGQPWMYSVLPLEMKLAGRPREEIERALLSRVDFAAGDTDQVLIAAALLSRMKFWNEALQLCREAVRMDPWQARVWMRAASIADRSGDPEAIVWSRCGILRYVWTDDAAVRHQEAEETLHRTIVAVQESGNTDLAARLREQVLEAKRWDLIVRAEWAGDSDVDLVVTEPGGAVCDHSHQITVNGGILVRTSSSGRRHVEEYRCQMAPPGRFRVRVRLIRGRIVSGRVRLTVERYSGSRFRHREVITVQPGSSDAMIDVDVERGRGRLHRGDQPEAGP